MIVLAAASVWLGRNSSIYDFWFYITTFSRYPMEIYQRPDRRLDPLGLHVRAADADRGQRAGPNAGQADAGRVLVFGLLRDLGHRRQPRRQPLGFSASAFKLS